MILDPLHLCTPLPVHLCWTLSLYLFFNLLIHLSLSFPVSPLLALSCLTAFPQALLVVFCPSALWGKSGEKKSEEERAGPWGLPIEATGEERERNLKQRPYAPPCLGVDKWLSNDLRLTGWEVKMKKTPEDRRDEKWKISWGEKMWMTESEMNRPPPWV